jgi:hypothetical protein
LRYPRQFRRGDDRLIGVVFPFEKNTAQVYDLILPDTIESRMFLLLDEKLTAIAGALGKLGGDLSYV